MSLLPLPSLVFYFAVFLLDWVSFCCYFGRIFSWFFCWIGYRFAAVVLLPLVGVSDFGLAFAGWLFGLPSGGLEELLLILLPPLLLFCYCFWGCLLMN
ncbi:hypothetical protein U1Q18_022125 [Sarracenia purpurea var. burkii]